MTEQPETDYPPEWTPWLKRDDENPIANIVSGMGCDDDHKPTDDTSYPTHWRI
jgi:hypothetical protein